MPDPKFKSLEFMPDVVAEIRDDAAGVEGSMSGDSVTMTFFEAFFDQFFASLGHDIKGWSRDSRRRAVAFVESRGAERPLEPSVKRLVVAFEEFCDLAKNAQGNYNGSGVQYLSGVELIQQILGDMKEWVGTLPAGDSPSALADKVAKALQDFEELE